MDIDEVMGEQPMSTHGYGGFKEWEIYFFSKVGLGVAGGATVDIRGRTAVYAIGRPVGLNQFGGAGWSKLVSLFCLFAFALCLLTLFLTPLISLVHVLNMCMIE